GHPGRIVSGKDDRRVETSPHKITVFSASSVGQVFLFHRAERVRPLIKGSRDFTMGPRSTIALIGLACLACSAGDDTGFQPRTGGAGGSTTASTGTTSTSSSTSTTASTTTT